MSKHLPARGESIAAEIELSMSREESAEAWPSSGDEPLLLCLCGYRLDGACLYVKALIGHPQLRGEFRAVFSTAAAAVPLPSLRPGDTASIYAWSPDAVFEFSGQVARLHVQRFEEDAGWVSIMQEATLTLKGTLRVRSGSLGGLASCDATVSPGGSA